MIQIPFFGKKKKEEEKPIFENKPIDEKDIIAPSSIKVSQENITIGKRLVKSFFIFSYPRYLSTAWLASAINLDAATDISMFMHPIDTSFILKKLRRKVTEVQSEIMDEEAKGMVRNPELETAFQDMERLRDRLQTAQEKMFRFALYVTVYADTVEELRSIQTTLRSIFESRLMYVKPALYQQKEGFHSCLPYGTDLLGVHNLMNTEPLSAVFPFVSFDLSSNEGIMYGMNRHNNSLILFDRFSMENANETIFATSGSGKSYAVKLEILRYLMWGVEVIVLDPENEYKTMTEAAGGNFFDISLGSLNHINPFDLPEPREDERPEDVLRSNVINLVGLMRLALGGMTPEEDAIMDRALSETYAAKDITPQSHPAGWKERIPLMQDLESVLETMEGTDSLVRRLRKFTKGTYANFFNQPSNISLETNIVTFGIRDMEDSLRPLAIYIVMRHIWNAVRSKLKRRIFVLDEAWWIMQSEDGASFLFGMVKRARKYWLGVTTITQDVEDFMRSEYGKPIITNSSMQLLMKQSPASIDLVQKSFALTSEEKSMLLETEVGEGIFFAGQKHVAVKVVASGAEHELITTAPEEIARRQARKRAGEQLTIQKNKLKTVAEEELAAKQPPPPPPQEEEPLQQTPPSQKNKREEVVKQKKAKKEKKKKNVVKQPPPPPPQEEEPLKQPPPQKVEEEIAVKEDLPTRQTPPPPPGSPAQGEPPPQEPKAKTTAKEDLPTRQTPPPPPSGTPSQEESIREGPPPPP